MLKVSQQNTVYKLFHSTLRYAHRTHYNVLKIQPNCNARDIRSAFIKLSKELHPDVNVSIGKNYDNKSFVELLEAYQVLSKPESRAAYDYELSLAANGNGQQIFHRPWASANQKHADYGEESYYGIKGVKKVSNWTIVLFCAVFMMIGICLQTIAISKSFTFKRQQLDEFSRQNAIQHAEVREEAEKHGNKAQIERMRTKLNKEII
ncbi:dnaJ-like protein 60 [Anopheles cruzii]|uniref:dnaJ-like protein 60 n=1 Tax=Anopheles cruzii TaxID=68878 RepID=UPI0022EC7214|nr:dnaJ-like protein 60 [Anopheles cruzii]